MSDSINISERDIFNFVFFTQLLPEQKRKYLENNKRYFAQIEIFISLKRKFDFDVNYKTKQIIASKIPVYKLPRLIDLFPVTNDLTEKSDQILNSKDIKAYKKIKQDAQTFIDDDKLFIVRIVKTNGLSVINLFSVQKNMIAEIKIILQPGNRHFILNDLDEPIKVKNLQTVESITLELI